MNAYYIAGFPVSDELYHHGILGQKWGVRRYQNEDGTLTEAGKSRYTTKEEKKQKKFEASIQRGKRLLERKRTPAGAVGRGIGREALILAGKAAAVSVLGSVGAAMVMSNPATYPIILAGSAALDVSALGATVGNIARSYKDVRDISRAQAKQKIDKG